MMRQADELRKARRKLNVNSAELAEMLGVSLPTLRSWIVPETSKAHRAMSKTAQLLLDRICAEAKRAKSKR